MLAATVQLPASEEVSPIYPRRQPWARAVRRAASGAGFGTAAGRQARACDGLSPFSWVRALHLSVLGYLGAFLRRHLAADLHGRRRAGESAAGGS